jgi:hypothetical protein
MQLSCRIASREIAAFSSSLWKGKVQYGVRSGLERTVIALSLCSGLGVEVSAPPRSSG